MMAFDLKLRKPDTDEIKLFALRLVWKIIDLNDNEQGARVKGQSWILMDGYARVRAHGWTEDDILKALSEYFYGNADLLKP